jgi:hypothetical protein
MLAAKQQLVEFIYSLVGKPLALLRNRRKSFRHELVIGAIFRNEARYLDEWLTFHHGVGVDHFFLYNNHSTDEFREVLEPWLQRGLVTLTDWPGKGAQVSAYGDCIQRFRNRARWIAFIDMDEFLFSPQSLDLREVLRHYNDVSAIFVYWVMFGSGGHTSRPAGNVIDSYTRSLDIEAAVNDTFDHHKKPGHVNYVTGWAQDGKTIVNPRLVRRYSVHRPKDLWHGTLLDENRKAPEQRVLGASISHSVLRINHYWSKSIEELTKKVEKGIANFEKQPKVELESWLERENKLNAEKDETILPTWRAIQSQAGQITNHSSD